MENYIYIVSVPEAEMGRRNLAAYEHRSDAVRFIRARMESGEHTADDFRLDELLVE